ncbi:kunitz-type protease inhibitor 2 isoform X5 [Chelonia mydas]|uniref:kunitz-type protease inhibitor 2 isoform X5 n=1 Tax=Chelonia mydas TaxID=8469 RepID=UPI0018A20036|nr:kunitz-type protease inhibitor 2 isoform X5 [Chelonia mydas]
MGRAGLLMLLLLAALGTGARGHEGSGEPAGSPAPGPPELCLLPKAVGRCRAAFPRWWYNATSRACQRFTYGGCGANLNNFLAEDDCRVRCAAAGDGEDVNEIPQASHRVVQSADEESPGRAQPANNTFTYEERCLAKAATGLCRASFPRWWFDVETKTCRQFTYGGCGGNPNNYLSEAECLARCSGGAEGPEPGVHSTRAVALAVLLAVLVAVLLGSVVIFFVWLCRRSQELSLSVPWSPLDDKEYLMSNAYTL